ncbi:MAG: methyltransferase domain-containing protein [Verrucomicrobia bacterium]|nr:methyltransferase domain-containing protein [Verrucomicrobiota bacterium]
MLTHQPKPPLNLSLERHQIEIQRNKSAWERKPVLRQIYASFYERIARLIDRSIAGRILEIGSGIGNLKSQLPDALSSDVFFNPWLDVVSDAYEIPFAGGTISHLVLFDVFHHLEAPKCFLKEARRVLNARGRLILFEPYISGCSFPVYQWVHPEPVAWRAEINLTESLPRPRNYYAAQGNATRVFFRRECPPLLDGWTILHGEALASFSYLLSGGFSKPCFYPRGCLHWLQRLDQVLSNWPKVFGARCLVALTPTGAK